MLLAWRILPFARCCVNKSVLSLPPEWRSVSNQSAIKDTQTKKHAPEMPVRGEKRRLERCLAEERRLREFSETALEAQLTRVISLEFFLGAIQDEKRRLEYCVAEERRLREFSESALEAQSSKIFSLECQRDAALVAAQEKVREVECMRKYGEEDSKKRDRGSLAIATSLQADRKKLVAERDELKQKLDALLLSLTGDKARLQSEPDAARIEVCAGKTECDTELPIDLMDVENRLVLAQAVRDATVLALAHEKDQVIKRNDELEKALTEKKNVEKRLESVEDERDAVLQAIALQKAEVIKCDTDLGNILIENRNLERILERERCATSLALAQQKAQVLRECDDKIETLVQAHKQELDKTKMDMGDMKMTLKSLREEKSLLDSAREATQKSLDEETEKRLCQICLDRPKDTVSLPCLHFNYCFSCLQEHRRRNNSCPSCRTNISGSLVLDIGLG